MTVWLNMEEHAAKRHTTAGAIRSERWRGEGPKAVRSGRILLWAEDEVDRWLASRAKSPAEPRQVTRLPRRRAS
jgi:predicted DNA-binding transcriptional regulator AlpA